MQRAVAVEEEDSFQPQDAIAGTIRGATVFGGVGLTLAAVRSSLAKQNVGAFGVFKQFGRSIGVFGLTGAAFQASSIVSGNLRQKNDVYNTAIGGALAGATYALGRHGTFPSVFGYAVGISVITSAWEYTGGSLRGPKRDPDVDEFERKQELRKNRRRPIQETVDELGEGRGIYAPGYQERRAQRIKENYGVDVDPSPSQSS